MLDFSMPKYARYGPTATFGNMTIVGSIVQAKSDAIQFKIEGGEYVSLFMLGATRSISDCTSPAWSPYLPPSSKPV